MDTKKLKEEFEKRFDFDGMSTYDGEMMTVDPNEIVWSWIETAITKARLASRQETIEQFVSGKIKAPQIERYIEATVKNIVTKAREEAYNEGMNSRWR